MGTALKRIWLCTWVMHSLSHWSRCKCGISFWFFIKYQSGDKGSIFWLTASILAGTWNSLQPHQDLAGSQTPFTIMGHHTNINRAISKPAVIINFMSFKRKRGFQPFERIFQMNNYTVWWCLISVYLWMLLKLQLVVPYELDLEIQLLFNLADSLEMSSSFLLQDVIFWRKLKATECWQK